MRNYLVPCTLLLLGLVVTTPALVADGPVVYTDIATQESSGIDYERQPSASLAVLEAIHDQGVARMEDFPGRMPIKPYGAPGVALLDFDGDGDLDIYATNGPGAANSLYENRLRPTGELTFVDVAETTGAAVTAPDSTGVCAGDIDNDGDVDLYVLSRGEPNHLLENLGGVFQDITDVSGAGGGTSHSMSCSFGDVNNDGLLDLVVSNTFDMSNSLPIFAVPFALNQHNLLFLNTGGNVFAEQPSSEITTAQDITWAIALVDIDQDGDVDVMQANDNGAILATAIDPVNGVDRGFLRWLENDGQGNLTDRTHAAGLAFPGDWMGLAFGDLDQDGRLDLMGSNSGDWFERFFGLPIPLGFQSTRWFLQREGGVFDDPGVGPDLGATPFGWGSGALDYDNDGDTDLLVYGGLESGVFVEASNPGCLFENLGGARFALDADAVTLDHLRRIEHGVAVGDLNLDGFPDIVSVSAFNLPGPPVPFPLTFGSVFDGVAGFFPVFVPGPDPGTLVFTGVEFPRGTLAVEINSGDNGNGWISVDTLGTVGITTRGSVNRDGTGAVISVTPHRGPTAIQPVVAGSSYASQHALELTFGLGSARRATVDVLWPGGVRNRLYDVRPGERLVFPEIPCDIADPETRAVHFVACVQSSLRELHREGVLSLRDGARFLGSALRAIAEERRKR